MGPRNISGVIRFILNFYFKAEIYGDAKDWIVTPHAFDLAIALNVGGVLLT